MWKEALEVTRSVLGSEDFEYVQQFQSAEQLQQEIQNLQEQSNGTAALLLYNVHGYLVHLQTWATFLVDATDSRNISLACVWGVACLLVQLGNRSNENDLKAVSRYLSDLSQKIELFEIYIKSVEPYPELRDRFFGVLMNLVLAGAYAIRCFRRNNAGPVVGCSTWNGVNKRFVDMLQDFTAQTEHLRQLVKAHQLTEMSLMQSKVLVSPSRLQPDAQRETAHLPYYQLPFGRNKAFYGRTNVLGDIRRILKAQEKAADQPAASSVPSVALWGAGGIGKSQIALEYANLRWLEKCHFVLWIPAQSEIDISLALARAARDVQPPGFKEDMSADQIRLLMWNWLRTTKTSWLLIFDNVDNNLLLQSNWPVTGNGQIVVTCRSENVAATPAAAMLEIPCFTPTQGGQLLLRLAHKTDVSDADIAAAKELSTMLSGLPLAIDITARQINVKAKSMEQFLPYFVKNKQNMRVPPRYGATNFYYNETLITVWQTAFDSLDTNSSRLLHLFCFCAPDDIPRDIINTAAPVPGTWAFLTDTQAYEEAEEQLLRMSLIQISENTGMISLHRLVQEAYYQHIPDQQHHEAFGVAYRLLCAAFPKRTLRRQMYIVWGQCEMLVQHIEVLQDKYEELRRTGLDVQDLALHTMLADATWFCSETCALQLGEKLGKRAAEACADKNSLIYAYLCESVATVDHRRGRYRDAHTFFVRSLSIREQNQNTTGPELADAYSAIGLALFGLFASAEAIEWVDKALAVAYAAPADHQHMFNIDRYLRNRSRPQAALRNFVGAKADVAAAEAFQTKIYGPDSHFHSETAYILGKIAIEEGDLDLAMQHLQRAYDLEYPGKPMHQSVASTLYHQARVCTLRPGDRQRNDEQALKYLQQALQITQFNEARRGDQGESARMKRRIAAIWERQGRVVDAATCRTAALRTKAELERTGLYPKAPDDEQAWDCFSDLVDR